MGFQMQKEEGFYGFGERYSSTKSCKMFVQFMNNIIDLMTVTRGVIG